MNNTLKDEATETEVVRFARLTGMPPLAAAPPSPRAIVSFTWGSEARSPCTLADIIGDQTQYRLSEGPAASKPVLMKRCPIFHTHRVKYNR